jgi:hypothetical protein
MGGKTMCNTGNETRRGRIGMFKELREGIYQLIALNSKGEYLNINTNTGYLLYCMRTANCPYALSSKISLLDYEKILSLESFGFKQFTEWVAVHSDTYNIMIDKINKGEIIFS